MHKAFDSEEPPWPKQELVGFRNNVGNPQASTTKMAMPNEIDTFHGQDNDFHHDIQPFLGGCKAGWPPSAISSGSYLDVIIVYLLPPQQTSMEIGEGEGTSVLGGFDFSAIEEMDPSLGMALPVAGVEGAHKSVTVLAEFVLD